MNWIFPGKLTHSPTHIFSLLSVIVCFLCRGLQPQTESSNITTYCQLYAMLLWTEATISFWSTFIPFLTPHHSSYFVLSAISRPAMIWSSHFSFSLSLCILSVFDPLSSSLSAVFRFSIFLCPFLSLPVFPILSILPFISVSLQSIQWAILR